MTTYKIYKNENYSTIDNRIFLDKDLSQESRFLLLYLLSKPADWHFQNWHIIEETGFTKYKFNTCLKELKTQGYVSRKRSSVDGRYVWFTDVYETKNPDIVKDYKDTTSRDSIGRFSIDRNLIDSKSTDKENMSKQNMSITKHENHSLGEVEKVKPRNLIWDSIVESFGFKPEEITRALASQIGKVVKDLNQVGATPEEVKQRHRNYRILHPDWELTPNALVKHWAGLTDQHVKNMLEITLKSRDREINAYNDNVAYEKIAEQYDNKKLLEGEK